jgi:hypothetical protein
VALVFAGRSPRLTRNFTRRGDWSHKTGGPARATPPAPSQHPSRQLPPYRPVHVHEVRCVLQTPSCRSINERSPRTSPTHRPHCEQLRGLDCVKDFGQFLVVVMVRPRWDLLGRRRFRQGCGSRGWNVAVSAGRRSRYIRLSRAWLLPVSDLPADDHPGGQVDQRGQVEPAPPVRR